MVLCGNGSVGKTSILKRFVDDGFSKVYRQTVGLDFFEKSVRLHGREPVTLRLSDIGGQSIASRMLDKYLGGSNAVFIVYDVTDTKSFADAEDWLAKVLAAARKQRATPSVFLVGNKADLLHSRQVMQSQHDAFVAENGLDGGFLVSAANGDRVMRAFYAAAGKASGHELSEHELSLHDTVVGVTTSTGASADEPAKAASPEQQQELERIAAEDAKAERRMEAELARAASAPSNTCCVVM